MLDIAFRTDCTAVFKLNICSNVISDIWFSKLSRQTNILNVICASILPPLAQKLPFLERPTKNKRKRHNQPIAYKMWRMRTFLKLPVTRCIQNWICTFCTFAAFSLLISDPRRYLTVSFALFVWFIIMITDCLLQVLFDILFVFFPLILQYSAYQLSYTISRWVLQTYFVRPCIMFVYNNFILYWIYSDTALF